MAKNFDPEVIGVLLVLLSPHPSGLLTREFAPYPWYMNRSERLMYFLYESQAPGLGRSEIKRHLEFMANLGLIKPKQLTSTTEGNWEDQEPFNQWQLSSAEEFGARIPPLDGERRNSLGGSDNGVSGNGRNGGGGNRGGGDDNDGGEGPADGGQGGGRGIAEVLSHPVLFSLPEAEFSNLIDGLFEGPGAP
jgi:hypothetical protein